MGKSGQDFTGYTATSLARAIKRIANAVRGPLPVELDEAIADAAQMAQEPAEMCCAVCNGPVEEDGYCLTTGCDPDDS